MRTVFQLARDMTERCYMFFTKKAARARAQSPFEKHLSGKEFSLQALSDVDVSPQHLKPFPGELLLLLPPRLQEKGRQHLQVALPLQEQPSPRALSLA
jgi:hypothetical protein